MSVKVEAVTRRQLLYFYYIDGNPVSFTGSIWSDSYMAVAEEAVREAGVEGNLRVLVALASGGAAVEEFQVFTSVQTEVEDPGPLVLPEPDPQPTPPEPTPMADVTWTPVEWTGEHHEHVWEKVPGTSKSDQSGHVTYRRACSICGRSQLVGEVATAGEQGEALS